MTELTAEIETTRLSNALRSLKIPAQVKNCQIISPLIRFSVALDPGTKVEKLESMAQKIAMEMKSASEPLIFPSKDEQGRFDGLVRLDLMVAAHPIVDFEETARGSGFDKEKTRSEYQVP